LIFIDNGSERANYSAVANHIKVHWKEAVIIRNPRNLFYAGGTNVGLRAAVDLPTKPDLVVALSNDVFVSSGWLNKMVNLMARNTTIGVLSPLTDNISRTCVNAEWVIKRWKILRSPLDLNAINKLPAKYLQCNGNVPLFCGMIRREVLEDVGYLHEEFFILGNDDDYNDRVRMAGWITAAALNVFVNHIHGATKHEIFPDRSEIRKRHRALLTERKAYRKRTGDYRA
jgi:GT2 family glycosyltransferase